MDVRRTRALVVLLVVTLVASACGSTVQRTGTTQEVASGEDGLGLETEALPGEVSSEVGEVGLTGGTATSGSRAARAGGAATTGTSPGSVVESPTGKRPVSSLSRGVTDDTITIGLEYAENSAAANAAIGAAGISQGDSRRNTDTLIKWVNANGGLAGRKVKAVYHALDLTSNQTTAQSEQEACATFTEDNEVYAVWTGNHTDTFFNCLTKNNVAMIGIPGLTTSDDQTFRTFPRWIEVNSLSLNAVARITPPGLAQLGHYKMRLGAQPMVLGLITFDNPRFRRAVQEDWLPALRRLKLPAPVIQYVSQPQRQSDAGPLAAQLASTVLRFRQAGVTHVSMLESSALLMLLFSAAAENQGYRPLYGLNSANGGQVLVNAGLTSSEQLRNAKLVGWIPDFDVIPKYHEHTPEKAKCDKIFKDAGITFPDENAKAVGYLDCEQFFFAKATFDITTGPIGPDLHVQGAHLLGSRYRSLSGPVKFSPTRHYGISRYRFAEFRVGCECWHYISDWRATPF